MAIAKDAVVYLEQIIEQQTPLPKLILQDMYMPSLEDGLYSLEGIRDRLAGCHCQQVPILAMTSSTEPEDIRHAYSSGASSVYLKPMNLSEWNTYFERLRAYWWETVMLPLI